MLEPTWIPFHHGQSHPRSTQLPQRRRPAQPPSHRLLPQSLRPDAANFVLNDNLSFEDALAHATDLLHCAVETAHGSAGAMNAQQRAVMHLVGMAKDVVGRALECVQPR